MFTRVLIIHPNPDAARVLADYFSQQAAAVRCVTSLEEARAVWAEAQPELVFFDLHLPPEEWTALVHQALAQPPAPRFIVTNKQPDFRRELRAQELGLRVFLREPFEPVWIEKALARLEASPARPAPAALPPVQVPVRAKITFPYALLALAFVLAAAYLVGRYLVESAQERFDRQLLEAGRAAGDVVVSAETAQLSTLRLIANTSGLAEALAAGDAEAARQIVLPLAVNDRQETVAVVDQRGSALIALWRGPDAAPAEMQASRGETAFAGLPLVQLVLTGTTDAAGDKRAGLVQLPTGSYLYVAGPVYSDTGRIAGAVLVGRSALTLARAIRQATQAEASFYDTAGRVLAATRPGMAALTLEPALAAQALQVVKDTGAVKRGLELAGGRQVELLGPWVVRGGQDLGVLGVNLEQTLVAPPSFLTGLQAVLIVVGIFALVILIGLTLANRITQPLQQIVNASLAVAAGRLDVKVDAHGNDEVTLLARAFNQMISGLQEGSIYRDLLGRSVSPEVREEMRTSFASGHLRLEGQAAIATILMTDVRGFTTLSEKVEPATILRWLNEYFGELVPAVTAHGGVVDKFEGDALLAFFGVLPRQLPPEASAQQACQAALAVLAAVESLNARRLARGEPALVTGVGVNTGPVTAGGLGTSDRLNYTVIGDAVNTAQRLESFTRTFGASGVAVSQNTVSALGAQAEAFEWAMVGDQVFKGKTEALRVYRLLGVARAPEALN